jgi:ketosteroid isomerase-like protein
LGRLAGILRGPVSQTNVEIVRRGFAALAEQGVEGVIRYFTEDVVIYSIPEWPDDPEYHGHDGVRRLFRQWAENFDEFRLELRELHDGGDSVVGLLELSGQTKRAALPMRMEIGAVYSGITDGRVAGLRLFSSWSGAWKRPGCGSSRRSALRDVRRRRFVPADSYKLASTIQRSSRDGRMPR